MFCTKFVGIKAKILSKQKFSIENKAEILSIVLWS